jgi:D-arabinan exo alpha-(1,3)/(1,5)-arabinofuranosidase (non-reducing end)
MKKSIVALVIIIAMTTAVYPAAARTAVNTDSLLKEMVDMTSLSQFPDPAFKTIQFSSYDRSSKIFGGERWFSNSDGFGRERIPAVLETLQKPDDKGVGRYLIAEVNGPGALVRGWTAAGNLRSTGMNGEIEMFLDGSKKPVFKGSARDFLTLLYPKIAEQHGIKYWESLNAFHQRDAGYYPVPFKKGCRVIWTGKINSVHFYHVEFRVYDKKTKVNTFKPEDLTTYANTIQEVHDVLAKPSLRPVPAGQAHQAEGTLEPLKPHEVLEVKDGGGMVSYLEIKLNAHNIDKALRQTVLLIYCDGFSRPQVEAPLGDFFGAAPGINPFDSVPIEVQEDGTMICRFVMPFKKRLHVWLDNRSEDQETFKSKIVVEDYKWDEESSMHFYARWRADHNLYVPGRRGFDVPYIIANGRGRFVGCAALLLNPTTIPHPAGSWWGEGDEKIFVDGDEFPSFFGTGSEDYFNYSWSSPAHFIHPYFAQPRNDGPGNCGFITNNRWHILDSIPFKNNFAFYMEMIHHSVTDGFSYARTSYYYAMPGVYDDHMPIQKEDLRELKMLVDWEPKAAGGANKAIFTQMEEMPGAERLIAVGDRWSKGKIVSWSPAKSGATLNLKFNVEKEGKYGLNLTMALSPGSGVFAIKLDGKTFKVRDGKERLIDLYTPHHTMIRNFGVGTQEMKKGSHTLTLISRDHNPESAGSWIGGDFIWIQPR